MSCQIITKIRNVTPKVDVFLILIQKYNLGNRFIKFGEQKIILKKLKFSEATTELPRLRILFPGPHSPSLNNEIGILHRLVIIVTVLQMIQPKRSMTVTSTVGRLNDE